MLEAKKWLKHYLNSLIPDYTSRLSSYTESFSASTATLANADVAYVSSVTLDVGGNQPGYDWYFSDWGTSAAQSELTARTANITEVTYKTGQQYCLIGYPKDDTKYPCVSIDDSWNLSSGGLGVNKSTVTNGDKINYSFGATVWVQEGEDYTNSTITEFELLDSFIEVLVNGLQKKGTGAENAIPYPFKELNASNCTKLDFDPRIKAFYKTLTITGETRMDIANSRW